MSYTLDVNVLLFAVDESSRFHRLARDFVQRLAIGPDLAYLFWPTLIGFIRIATHPSVLSEPLGLTEAMKNVESLMDRPNVHVPGERSLFWKHFRAVTDDAIPSGNLVSDAHVVALMRENGVRTIWTHDRDYRRFSGIEVRDPFPPRRAG